MCCGALRLFALCAVMHCGCGALCAVVPGGTYDPNRGCFPRFSSRRWEFPEPCWPRFLPHPRGLRIAEIRHSATVLMNTVVSLAIESHRNVQQCRTRMRRRYMLPRRPMGILVASGETAWKLALVFQCDTKTEHTRTRVHFEIQAADPSRGLTAIYTRDAESRRVLGTSLGSLFRVLGTTHVSNIKTHRAPRC